MHLLEKEWPLLFKEMHAKHPDARFILTTRNLDDWFGSLENHFGLSYSPMRDWIYGNGIAFGNKSTYIETHEAS